MFKCKGYKSLLLLSKFSVGVGKIPLQDEFENALVSDKDLDDIFFQN